MNLLINLLKRSDAVLVGIFTILIILYRIVSKLFAPKCRFYPTCSRYALQVLKARGFICGLPLILKRLSKCHPFNEGGYDPVK